MITKFIKQPSETLDYEFDFGGWMPPGDSIQVSLSTSTVTVPVGLTAGTKEHITDANIVRQWLSGGTDGVDYKVTCDVTTVQGRTKSAEMIIRVIDL